MANNNNNQILVPQSRQNLNQMKYEIASELGFQNYNQIDKGSLPSRANGYVGGNITKRLVSLGEAALANSGGQVISATQSVNLETPQQ
ncbi:Small, acid-soluble spore protein alpha [Pelotomaculum schinkii]|uniref:Small, acid-soluble spore protein alpha n=1 Tax=Pelotomaculum schinkii TaxID=78350 RepID=A0A4Y7RD24_9FIRM|nr:alpha/beta-type small acid-soluble spore protein [Pelotomaculum schinkii]TEB06884.1 Small, acid-soluble spore protein alpha [Pelotomaculum schinkii]